VHLQYFTITGFVPESPIFSSLQFFRLLERRHFMTFLPTCRRIYLNICIYVYVHIYTAADRINLRQTSGPGQIPTWVLLIGGSLKRARLWGVHWHRLGWRLIGWTLAARRRRGYSPELTRATRLRPKPGTNINVYFLRPAAAAVRLFPQHAAAWYIFIYIYIYIYIHIYLYICMCTYIYCSR